MVRGVWVVVAGTCSQQGRRPGRGGGRKETYAGARRRSGHVPVPQSHFCRGTRSQGSHVEILICRK